MEFEQILNSLEEDIQFYKESIKEIAIEILDNKVSEYPIFVAHKNIIELGELILNKDDFDKNWSINASVLEELMEAGVINKSKATEFKKIYKDPKKNICIFLVTEEYANFIFMPYESNVTTADPQNN